MGDRQDGQLRRGRWSCYGSINEDNDCLCWIAWAVVAGYVCCRINGFTWAHRVGMVGGHKQHSKRKTNRFNVNRLCIHSTVCTLRSPISLQPKSVQLSVTLTTKRESNPLISHSQVAKPLPLLHKYSHAIHHPSWTGYH